MKKIVAAISLLLALCMVACSSSIAPAEQTETKQTQTSVKTEEKKPTEEEAMPEGPHDPTGFATGFGKALINPEPGTGLGGFGNTNERLSKTIQDDIYISCVAVSDGEKKVLLFSVDSLGVSKTVWGQIARNTEKELGIPRENIILNASHSHAAPNITGSFPSVAKYMKIFYDAALSAAKYAVADLDRTEVKTAKTQTDGLSYIRRYIKKSTGEFVGNWPNNLNPEKYDHESSADEEMLILYFDRANQKDIVLCNWTCHVTNVGSRTGGKVSSDFVGVFRDTVAEKLNAHCAFFQGAAGSTIPLGALKGENANNDYKKLGADLSQVLVDAIPSLTSVKTGKIETMIQNYDAATGPQKSMNMELSVIAFGDVAFATAPFEMDHRNGKFVKENSPYPMTFMSAYSNGYYQYIPAESSFPNGGYEVESCQFVAGTGEGVANSLVSALKNIHDR